MHTEEELNALYQMMLPLVEKVGIPMTQYRTIKKRAKNEYLCDYIVNKLLELKEWGYDPWLKVRRQPHVTEEMWLNYETLFKEFEMPEQIMLRDAEKGFVTVFKRVEKEIGREYKKVCKPIRPTSNKLATGKQVRRKKTGTAESNS